MLIIAGFWGFLMGCVIFPGAAWSWSSGIFATTYGTPVTLSAMTFNILMGFGGGAIAAWVMTRDPFWMMSGALGGIINVAGGLDLYWLPMAFVIAMIGGVIMPIVSNFVEKKQIDDAVGAVALHETSAYKKSQQGCRRQRPRMSGPFSVSCPQETIFRRNEICLENMRSSCFPARVWVICEDGYPTFNRDGRRKGQHGMARQIRFTSGVAINQAYGKSGLRPCLRAGSTCLDQQE